MFFTRSVIDGSCVLLVAVESGDVQIVKMLLMAGADPTTFNHMGELLNIIIMFSLILSTLPP